MDAYKPKSKFWKFCWCGGISLVGVLSFATVAQAQNRIIPDGTLGAEQSIVGPTDEITGGATRSQNLFHSFSEFSIGRGNSAYFNTGNSPIANIFARVTGANQSAILGILGTRGVSNANLFLINPNGIVFGPEGSLDVQGSFIGTTANAIQFSDQSIFSASDPNSSSLVTVKPSALLFNRINSGAIENQSVADAKNQFNSVAKDGLKGLRVPDGQNLLLVGGDVFLNGGDLHALGGRIELGGIESTGIVGINLDSGAFQLDFPDNNSLANVTFDNQSKVNVTAGGDGRISIAAKQIKLQNGSDITAGISENQGSTAPPSIGTAIRISTDVLEVNGGTEIHTDILRGGSGNSGNIEISARKKILLDGQMDVGSEKNRSSKITSRIEPFGQGKGGNIRINTGSLTIKDGAFISTSTDADGGTPGTISITARENVSLIGVGTDVPSTISSQVLNDATGNAGSIDLTITEGSLSISGGASINTSTKSQGDAGNIKIDVRDGIKLDSSGKLEVDTDGILFRSSGIFSEVRKNGQGSSGLINISSETLDVTNGAQISALIENNGTDISNIDINTKGNITLNGQSSIKNSDDKFVPSGIFSNLTEGGSSQGGSIKITSEEGSLMVEDGARINANTDGVGNAQNIFIDVRGDAIFTGQGNNLETDGTTDFSGIYSQALSNSTGDAGDIRIEARSVELQNGARILNNTDSRNGGNAGNVEILPQQSLLIEDKKNRTPGTQSRIESNVGNVNANSGNISIGKPDQKVNFVTVRNGGFITTSNSGQGKAGNISIYALNSVQLEGDNRESVINSNLNPGQDVVGKGGNIRIDTGSLSLKGKAAITTNTFSKGDAGRIEILARDGITLESESDGKTSKITSGVGDDERKVGIGEGGVIDIKANSLTLKNGSTINTSTFKEGGAGEINIVVDNEILLESNNNDRSSITSRVERTGVGKGGVINIEAGSLTLKNGPFITTSSFGKGDAGNINILVDNRLTLEGTSPNQSENRSSIGSQVFENVDNDGGFINIKTGDLDVKGGAFISTLSSNAGNAGNIDITANKSVKIQGDRSEILTNLAGTGTTTRQAGTIDLKANSLEINDKGLISTKSTTLGNAGALNLTIDDLLTLDNGSLESDILTNGGNGTGGNLTVIAKDLKLSNFSEIKASNTGQGDAGNINLKIANQIDSIDSKISTDTQTGAGGRVDIFARNIILKGDSDIQTSVASGVFKGGDITIDSNFLIAFDDSDILAFAVDGTGGNIDFSRTIFFGESYQPSSTDSNSNIDPSVFNNNSRVDINASGGIASGTVLVPDSSFVQNSVTDLPDNVIPPDQLTAGSCIARRTASNKSSFVVTGNDGLPTRPNGSIVSAFPTGTVRSATTSPKADKTEGGARENTLTEPTGVFELEDGRMVLSQACH